MLLYKLKTNNWEIQMQTGNTIYCSSPERVTGAVTRKYTGSASTSSDDTSAGTKSVNLSSRQSVSDEGSQNLENRMRLGIKNKWTCFVLRSPFTIFAVEMNGRCVDFHVWQSGSSMTVFPRFWACLERKNEIFRRFFEKKVENVL